MNLKLQVYPACLAAEFRGKQHEINTQIQKKYTSFIKL